jgi:hypothetical protein
VVLGYSLWCRFYQRQDMRTLVSGLFVTRLLNGLDVVQKA